LKFNDYIAQLEASVEPGSFQEIVRSLKNHIQSPANPDWIVQSLSKHLEAHLKAKLGKVKQKFDGQLLRVDEMIKEGLLVDADTGIRTLRSLTDYFSTNGKERERKGFEAAIEERVRLVEISRAEIAAQLEKRLVLEPGSSNVGEIVNWAVSLKDVMEMATRAGIPVLAEKARALFQEALHKTREALTRELTKVKAQFIQDPSDAMLEQTRSILEKIQGLSGSLYLLTIKQETSKLLSNLVLVKSLLTAVRGRGSIPLKELRERTTMEREAFASFLLEWAGILGLIIAQDVVCEDKEKEDLDSIIRRLDEIFRSWEEKEKIEIAGKI